ETSKGEPSAAVMARLAVTSSRPRSTSVRSLSGRGITFSVTSVMTASVPQELARIVAGNVLHHLAAGLEAVAEARDRVRAEQMIARPARLDPARSGEPRRDHAADGST